MPVWGAVAGGIASLGGSIIGALANKPEKTVLQPYMWEDIQGSVGRLKELGQRRLQGGQLSRLGVSDILAPTYRATMSTLGSGLRRGGTMNAAERRQLIEGGTRSAATAMAPATAQAYGIVSERDIERARLQQEREARELLAQIEAEQAAGQLALGGAQYRTSMVDYGNIELDAARQRWSSGIFGELGQLGGDLLARGLFEDPELKKMLMQALLSMPQGGGQSVQTATG